MQNPLHDHNNGFAPVSQKIIRNFRLEIHHVALIYSRTELTVATSETQHFASPCVQISGPVLSRDKRSAAYKILFVPLMFMLSKAKGISC